MAKQRKKILLVDGYNVLRSGSRYQEAFAHPDYTDDAFNTARERLITDVVDGYNIIHATPKYEKLIYDRSDDPYTSDVFDAARMALIADVAAFAQGSYEAVIVFDGGDNQFSTGEVEIIGGVRIMFSPAGTSADKVIEKLAHDARVRNVETMVVTSDATIQDTVFGGGIDRMSANGFSREVGMYYEDVHLDETPKVALKRTLGDRIKPDILEKLKAMRDGA